MVDKLIQLTCVTAILLMVCVSCYPQPDYEQYSADETYSLTLKNSLVNLPGIHDGFHEANLTIYPHTTPEDQSANFIETTCNYNHLLRKHQVVTAVYGIVGEFDTFSSPNKLSFSFPLKLTYDFVFANSEKNYFYSDYYLFRIPINEDKTYLVDCLLDESSWVPVPITWTDTTVEDYTNPIVSCESDIFEINSLYTIARIIQN